MRTLLAAVSLMMLVLAPPNCCRADSIFTDLGIIRGRVTSLDENGLAIQVGCHSSDTRKWTWSEVREVLFDAKCDSDPARLPSAGGSVCTTAPVQVLIIYFRGAPRPVYAISAELALDRTLNYVTYNNMAGHGPISDVRGIASRLACPSDISDALPSSTYLLASSCSEQRYVAIRDILLGSASDFSDDNAPSRRRHAVFGKQPSNRTYLSVSPRFRPQAPRRDIHRCYVASRDVGDSARTASELATAMVHLVQARWPKPFVRSHVQAIPHLYEALEKLSAVRAKM